MAERPVVAIIGRPNVGKSTLFNRLTGRRSALVSDMPGLTRDRRGETAELLGIPVTLLDTAGLEEAPKGSIPARMREQSEQAVRDADLVLFVIDARDGITPADEKFADIVRKAGCPTVLVANKCEGRQGDDGFYEAFALGLGQPVAISAEHGEGITELERDILSALGRDIAPRDAEGSDLKPDAAATERPIRIAIVGRPNAGKSTLVNALLGEERMITGPEPGLTRDSIESDFEWKGRPLRIVDTAGLRRKSKITARAEKLSASDAVRTLKYAEVVVVMIDAEHPLEHQDLTIAAMVADEGRAIVIAINKWDLIAEKQATLRQIHELVGRKLAQVPGVRVVPVSALAERGLDKLMAAIFDAYEVWNKRVATHALNEWLRATVDRHPPPAVTGRRIRLRYITQPSARPPTFVAFCSRPNELPQSYVRYLLNGLRDTFSLPGTPIRFNLRKGENPFAKRG